MSEHYNINRETSPLFEDEPWFLSLGRFKHPSQIMDGIKTAGPSKMTHCSVWDREHFGTEEDRKSLDDLAHCRRDPSALMTKECNYSPSTTETKVKMTVRSMCGGGVNIGRYLAGDPMCMTRTVRRKVKSPVISIGVHQDVPWHVSDEDVDKAVTEIGKAIVGLENQGFKVRLDVARVTVATRDNSKSLRRGVRRNEAGGCIMTVKEAQAPLDLHMMATAMSCGFIRELCDTWLTCARVLPKDLDSSLGLVYGSFDKRLRDVMDRYVFPDCDLVLNLRDLCGDDSGQPASEWIQRRLEGRA